MIGSPQPANSHRDHLTEDANLPCSLVPFGEMSYRYQEFSNSVQLNDSQPKLKLFVPVRMDNLVVSNIRQRPIRTLVSVAGVALGVCLVMLFTGLARGMSNDLQRRASNVRAEIIFTRPGAMMLTGSSANLSTKYVESLKQIEGVAEALPVIRYVSQAGKGFGFEQIEGVEWEPFARVNELTIDSGRPPQTADEIVIDEVKARNSKLRIGDPIKVF